MTLGLEGSTLCMKGMNNLLCQFHECLLHPYLTFTAHTVT